MSYDHDPDQDRLVELFSSTTSGAALNGSGVGAGKTLVAVRTIAERAPERLLIIAQPNVYRSWAETIESVTGKQLLWAGSKAKAGTPAKVAMQNLEDAKAGKSGWYYVGREMFNIHNWKRVPQFKKKRNGERVPILLRNGKQKVRKTRLDAWGVWDMVIYDECQMFANWASGSNQSFRNLKADFKLAQSADWYGTNLENMWSVAKALWPEFVGEQKQKEFITEFLETEYDHWAPDNIKVVGEQWPGFFSTTLPAYAALPPAVEPPEPEKRYVALTRQEKRLYDDLNANMAAELDGDLLVTEMHTTLYQRLRELCLGVFQVDYHMVKQDDGEMVEKQTIRYEVGDPSSTIDEIKAIMADYPDEHFIILTHSQKWAEKAAVELGGMPYTGAQSISEKDRLFTSFLAGETKVLVGTEAMSEGLDGLQAVCHNAIVASRPGTPYKTTQFIGRVARRGQEHPVNLWEIVRENTIDEGVVDDKIAKVLRNNKAKAIAKKQGDV